MLYVMALGPIHGRWHAYTTYAYRGPRGTARVPPAELRAQKLLMVADRTV